MKGNIFDGEVVVESDGLEPLKVGVKPEEEAPRELGKEKLWSGNRSTKSTKTITVMYSTLARRNLISL